MRLFYRHQQLREQFARACDLDDEAAEDAIFDRMVAVENEMMALPSISAADFAAKVIVDTSRGGLFSDWETGALWIEARELTGCGG